MRRQLPSEDTAQGQGGKGEMNQHARRPGRDRRRSEPGATTLPRRVGRAAQALPRRQPRPHQGGRRHGADRRRPRLPVGRAGRRASARGPATRTRSPGEWRSETEVIESAAELVELYNPAEIFAAFAEAAREQAGLPDEPTAADDLMDVAGIAPDETVGVGHWRRHASPRRATPARPMTGRARRRSTSSRRAQRKPLDGCTTWRSPSRSAASTPRRG